MSQVKSSIETILEKTSNNTLKKKCNDALDILNQIDPILLTEPFVNDLPIENIQGEESDLVKLKWFQFVNFVVEPLECACSVGNVAIQSIAVDAIEKLMTYGFLPVFVPYMGAEEVKEGEEGLFLIHRVCKAIALCFRNADDDLQVKMIKALTTSICVAECGVHSFYLMESFRIIINIYLTTGNEFIRNVAKGNLENMLLAVFRRLGNIPIIQENIESLDDVPIVHPENSENDVLSRDDLEETEESISFQHSINPETRDCVMIIIGLCKIVNKEFKRNQSLLDRKSKIVSLNLIHFILSNCNEFFDEQLIKYGIRKNICLCISKTATSLNPDIYEASLVIFYTLLLNFRESLKEEAGVFFDILFTLLHKQNFNIELKLITIRTFYDICQNPQLLVDIYVNYDCDLERTNYFTMFVDVISRLSHRNIVTEIFEGSPEYEVRLYSLNCLVKISDSLVEWSSELYNHKTSVSDHEDTDESIILHPSLPILEGDIQANKLKKTIVERAITLFNVNPKKGLQLLFDNEILSNNPKDIAQFLFTTTELKTTVVGIYLSALKNLEVMKAYVDNHHQFDGLPIDVALRQFLYSFRLPGEAQQIDRIMELFAHKYYSTNTECQNLFINADSVYVLSFAIIMLATDLHSPFVLAKMGLTTWKKNLRGLNEDEDFDDEMLNGIYERIGKEQLQVRDGTLHPTADILNETDRQNAYQVETEIIAQKAQEILSAALDSSSTYFRETNIAYVKPIFETAWGPMIATFSIILEDTENEKLINLCMEGFKSAIRVSSVFYMDMERDSFVTALSKFTSLDNENSITVKHLSCINALFDVALSEGNFLREAWYLVLKCASDFERVLTTSHIITVGDRIISTDYYYHKLNELFSATIKLENFSIIDFVRSLTKVSVEELVSNRIFSLQKIVELSVFNMPHRIKIVWFKIWEILSEHFTVAGTHPNREVAIFSVDSLRQLSTQFMSSDELSNFHFQKHFLSPFIVISQSKSKTLRMYVIETIQVMIKSVGQNIRSGWSSIFSVLTAQAHLDDSNRKVAKLAFDTVEIILDGYYGYLKDNFYEDVILCLITYSNYKYSEEININAIKRIESCTNALCSGEIVPLSRVEDFEEPFNGVDHDHFIYWKPLLTGLVEGIQHDEIHIRTYTLDVFFKILNSKAQLFSLEFWKMLFTVILPPLFYEDSSDGIFEIVSKPKALHNLVLMYTEHHQRLSTLLGNLLDILEIGILSDNETLSTLGIDSLDILLSNIGDRLNLEQWNIAIDFFNVNIDRLLNKIFEVEYPEKSIQISLGQLRNCSLLTKVYYDTVSHYHTTLQSSEIKLIAQGINRSSTGLEVHFTKDKCKKLEISQIEIIVKLKSSFTEYFLNLLSILESTEETDSKIIATDLLGELLYQLERVPDKKEKSRLKSSRGDASRNPKTKKKNPKIKLLEDTRISNLTQILEFIITKPSDNFQQQVPQLYKTFTNLIDNKNPSIRTLVKTFFQRVGTELHNYEK